MHAAYNRGHLGLRRHFGTPKKGFTCVSRCLASLTRLLRSRGTRRMRVALVRILKVATHRSSCGLVLPTRSLRRARHGERLRTLPCDYPSRATAKISSLVDLQLCLTVVQPATTVSVRSARARSDMEDEEKRKGNETNNKLHHVRFIDV